MKKFILGIFLSVCWCSSIIHAQDVALKTNLLYWLTTTPNLAMEFGVGEKSTVELSVGYNPWTLNKEENRKIKHIAVIPEYRYWLCEPFNGHFFGVHAGYTYYNLSAVRILPFGDASTKDHRYQGWGIGAGLSYGYSWILNDRWSIEATVGFGYIYTNLDKYQCATCGYFRDDMDHHYVGPTNAGISLIYTIK